MIRTYTCGLGDWPRYDDIRPHEGKQIRMVSEGSFFDAPGTYSGTLVKAHADWWACLLKLDGTAGRYKFLELRHVTEWEVADDGDPAS